MADVKTSKPVAFTGAVLGIGLGGVVDGILLHQIFQLHAMFSARLPLVSMANMQTNMAADGIFHAILWLVTLAGVIMLFRNARRLDIHWSGRAFYGSMLIGWGVFNLVEGIVNHHLLEVHHVVQRLGPSSWDWAFLGLSVLIIIAGCLVTKNGLIRRRRRIS